MVRFVSGDMFEDSFDIRVNTVNCVGVMGAGVALAFRERYPEMYKAYKEACERGLIQPGKIEVWRTLTEWIVNFPTKRHWRNKSTYEDIQAGLLSLREYLASYGRVRVALPALGCGHGGLDWNRVRPMIEHALADLEAEVFVFEPGNSVAAGQHARQVIAEKRGLKARQLTAADVDFPVKLRELGISQVYILGDSGLLKLPSVAVLHSRSPEERETSAALACVEALSGKATLSLSFGTKLSHRLAAGFRSTVLWSAEGLHRLRVPDGVLALIREGRTIIATTAEPDDGWDPQRARQATRLQLLTARAVILTSQSPSWPPLDLNPDKFPPTFFIRYETIEEHVVARLRARGIHAIGRSRLTTQPNISQIVELLAHVARA